jgi:S-adenosylmethionine:tRNA ribosyltransferase-isomerase
MFKLSDFDFQLPPELIAQQPAKERAASRLLLVKFREAPKPEFEDKQFTDLLSLLNPGDVLVFNNSKVIPARLYGQKESGGKVEVLVERIVGGHEAIAMLRVSKKPVSGSKILVGPERLTGLSANPGTDQADSNREGTCLVIEVLGRHPEHDDRFRLKFSMPVLDALHAHGEVPLPPYITHTPTEQDTQRYQTVYAQTPGSVAAPTAGLHFDEAMLSALDKKGVQRVFVTLHVGTGTFAPVRTENLDEHRMHTEWCEVPKETAAAINLAKREGRRVIAVGTTSLRTLESAQIATAPSVPRNDGNAASPLRNDGNAASPPCNDEVSSSRGSNATVAIHPGAWETSLFIRPGYQFKVIDGLLTNFHLPKSTLLMLVSALIGYDTMQSAYAHAIEKRYRFFSYGDAMLCI